MVTTVIGRLIVAKKKIAEAGGEPPKASDPVRGAVRFPLRLELVVGTEMGEESALTEDVSASGVLFVMDSLPPLESRVEFTITMPGVAMGSLKDVTVHCTGRIVRHELSGQVRKAAAVIDEYTLKA